MDTLTILERRAALYSGHRIGAIRHLRWSDIDFAKSTIRWIGDSWVFPSPEDATRLCSSSIMRDWMERGLKKVGLGPGMRYGWHSLRRQFATDLKHIPLSDLCALGGKTQTLS